MIEQRPSVALKILRHTFENDKEYAELWRDNIASCCYDKLMRPNDSPLFGKLMHDGCTKGANDFMKLCFDIEVRDSE